MDTRRNGHLSSKFKCTSSYCTSMSTKIKCTHTIDNRRARDNDEKRNANLILLPTTLLVLSVTSKQLLQCFYSNASVTIFLRTTKNIVRQQSDRGYISCPQERNWDCVSSRIYRSKLQLKIKLNMHRTDSYLQKSNFT